MQLLLDLGLAAQATRYVGTRGGESRGLECVLSSQVERYFQERSRVAYESFCLPAPFLELHAVFHLFCGMVASMYGPIRLTDDQLVRYTVSRRWVDRALTLLVEGGAGTWDAQSSFFTIQDPEVFKKVTDRWYFKPTVDYVMGGAFDPNI
jgi:hypothetical protein